ncbi:hypothetical protein Y981_09490 [Leptospirillum ferriphilum YSK]|uniref:Uncharacterized protein n=1 Tax=Leptospirillum ferriphilum YSK TaxID=1441628 RepID=A0A059Y2T2_9BACT|nr:hypothetical protein Y981_09490 [Leptospirillum ferriphilum YSK]
MVDQRLKNLKRSPLDQTIQHGRYSQFPHPSFRFRNFDTANRLRTIYPLFELFPDLWPLGLERLGGLFYRQSVNSCAWIVLLDALTRQDHALSLEHLRQQIFPPRAFVTVNVKGASPRLWPEAASQLSTKGRPEFLDVGCLPTFKSHSRLTHLLVRSFVPYRQLL